LRISKIGSSFVFEPILLICGAPEKYVFSAENGEQKRKIPSGMNFAHRKKTKGNTRAVGVLILGEPKLKNAGASFLPLQNKKGEGYCYEHYRGKRS
jgi:hypothetical protein